MKRRIISVLLIIVLSSMVVSEADATSISDLKRQQDEVQRQLDEITGSLSDLQGEKGEIDDEIHSMDTELMQVMASVDLLKEDIATKEEEIAEAQAAYEDALAREQQQYAAMKKRIQFMYEKGDQTYIQLLFEADNLSDMLNKAEYIEQIYKYDREKLKEFQDTKQEVADLKEQLEVEKAELETQKFELEEEQASLQEMLDEKKAEAKDYEVQIAQIQQVSATYKAKIKQQAALIKQMEAEEARKAAEAAKKNGTSNSNSQTYTRTAASAAFDLSQIDKATGSAKGKEVAKFACQFIGNPYVAGGSSLTNGADCSGFTQSVYKNFGYSIPRNSTSQRGYGTEVSLAAAEPGDIVCYAGHVALYIGNGMIVHASTQKTGIKISYVNYRPVLSVRRIL